MGLEDRYDMLEVYADAAGNTVKDALDGILNQSSGQTIGRNMAQGVASGIRNNTGTVTGAARNLASQAAGAMRSMVSSLDFPGIGYQMDVGVAIGIRNNAGIISQAAREAARRAYEAAKDELDIHSPSGRGAWIGEMWDKGVAGGIDDHAWEVAEAAGRLGDLFTEEAETNIGGGAFGSAGGGIDYDRIGDAVQKPVEGFQVFPMQN